jgi:asparagine synthase (glutamine-hydrolysing)
MCGISGYVSMRGALPAETIRLMTRPLAHRGPDGQGLWTEPKIALGNRRLAVLDLSPRGGQPMRSHDGRFVMTYNGEVYNYVELKAELQNECETGTDTEVVLEAFAQWGTESLHRLNGMFAFAVWDRLTERLVLVRDRFGVKPLYYAEWDGALYFASEIKALAAAGVPLEPDSDTWAVYLRDGAYDFGSATFFKGIRRLPPGHYLTWDDGRIDIHQWYDLAERVQALGWDERADSAVALEYHRLLQDAVRLRFRSDVPVGVCLSGGLDSSTLAVLLKELFGTDQSIHTYHFATGDPRYDETPWVRQLLADLRYPLSVSYLDARQIPALAEEAIGFQEEPFGGLPTLAMIQLFKQARRTGTIVLLDGQGLDEQWAGYDYYAQEAPPVRSGALPVQGALNGAHSPACLAEEFRSRRTQPRYPEPFDDRLQNMRYRDLRFTKLPRALRFNDRASSQASCELREPFLDYRLVELAFRQPARRLIRNGQHKALLRDIVRPLLPPHFTEAPKRPVQTPQREWLRGPLRPWVEDCLADSSMTQCGWFDPGRLRRSWNGYLTGASQNSFPVWQWISVTLNRRFIDSMRAARATRKIMEEQTPR